MKKKLLVILMILSLTSLFASCGQDKDNAADNDVTPAEKNEYQIEVEGGIIEGSAQNGVASFMGVPFAAPPVGQLRFAPPEPVIPWQGILDCTKFENSAPQAKELEDLGMDEDCLYLNIWAPDTEKREDLPVYVYIHGGAYAQGSPSKPLYNGSRFAKDGIIQVNISYRLNALGFWGSEELEAQTGYIGNAGILDQIAALKWVQNNIEAFGGDPENVTVGGESAGAFSVSNLILSPMAEGLFQKAILESGNLLGQRLVAPLGDGQREKHLIASETIMTSLNAANLEDMRSMEVMELVNASKFESDMTKPNNMAFWPVFDGKVIPENPYEAVKNGAFNKVDILAGYNTHEGTIFIPEDITKEDYEAFADLIFGEHSGEVLEQYPVDENHSATDRARNIVLIGMILGNEIFADYMTAAGQNAYLYHFAYDIPVLDELGYGTMHAMELPFVFGIIPDKASSEMEQMMENVHNRWLNFIVSGDPNVGDEVQETIWPKYTASGKETLRLDTNLSVEALQVTDDIMFFKKIIYGE